MESRTILVLLLIAVNVLAAECEESTLKKVQVVFRHGIRYPMRVHWKEGCAESYRADLLGNLTESGRNQMRMLGLYLRARYDKLIGANTDLVEINYSDHYRNLESSLYVSEGLYGKSLASAVRLEKLEKKDLGPIYSNYSYIPAWMETNSWSDDIKDLCKKLDGFQGMKCKRMMDLMLIADQMNCEKTEGCSFPAWLDSNTQALLEKAYSDMMELTNQCKNRQFVTDNSDTVMNKINNVFNSDSAETKIITMYALHDINLEIVKARIGIPYSVPAVFGAALIFEQHVVDGQRVIRVLFDNSLNYTNFQSLKVAGCDVDCPYEKFKNTITAPNLCYDNLSLDYWSYAMSCFWFVNLIAICIMVAMTVNR